MNKNHYELYGKKWYQKNKAKNLERGRKWQRLNRKRSVEIVQAYVKRNKQKVAEYNRSFSASIAGKYRTIVYRHKKRLWKEPIISIEFFSKEVVKPCAYCGKESFMGLDRIDNLKGYSEGNVVSCCELCNHMKWKLTQDEFLKHIKLIASARTV